MLFQIPEMKYTRDYKVFVLLLSLATHKNTLLNLVLLITQSKGRYGQSLSGTQTFFSNLDNQYFLLRLVSPLIILVISERTPQKN